MRSQRALVLVLLVTLVGGGACGGDSDDGNEDAAKITAQVASYDLTAGTDQRVIVGLVVEGSSQLVGFGTVQFAFAYAGTRESPIERPQPGPPVTAEFRPIPGQRLPPGETKPRLVEPSEGIGVYAAEGVRFDRPGLWGLTVSGRVGQRDLLARTGFEVLAKPAVPVPGEAAPRTENPLPGAPDVPPKAVDSRAEADGSIPDPELHAETVAASIASGRPTMVVVSTPVYCQSRFCGPITDSVQRLAQANAGRMGFVHLEVWRDFESQTMNRSAAEWIYRERAGDIHEPWVFVVGRDGTIIQRFDNVVSEGELEAAVRRAVG